MTEAVARAWSRWIGGAAVGHRDIMSLRGCVFARSLPKGRDHHTEADSPRLSACHARPQAITPRSKSLI